MGDLGVKSPDITMENPKKSRQKFDCITCLYHTSKKTDFLKHCSTAKHLNSINCATLPQKTPKKITCLSCNFHTHNQKDYDRHVQTNKHKNNINIPVTDIIVESGTVPTADTNLTALVIELIKDNKELRNSMLELAKNQSIANSTVTTNSHNNNTNNNQFNLNFFLNETCKDAMNIEDFIKTLHVTMEDFKETGRLGYVEGITRIILNGLKQVDTTKRPIHCTDIKRETVYVKNQDAWEKENQDKEKLKSAVNQVARMNLSQLPRWQQDNPASEILDTKEHGEYMKFAKAALGGMGEKEEERYVDKIMKNVMKEVAVDKSNYVAKN